MFTVAGLMREHSDLNRRAMRLERLMAPAAPPPIDEVMRQLQQFSDLLIAHLGVEEEFLYPYLLASNNPRIVRIARSIGPETGDMTSLWLGYRAKWTRGAVIRDWPAFRSATDDILGRLSRRIIRENRILFALADAAPELAA